MAYEKGKGLFLFNFDPVRSYEGYFIPTRKTGSYEVVISTDDSCYGGHDRVSHQCYEAAEQADGRIGFQIYVPCRTAIVLMKKEMKRGGKYHV